MAGFGLHSDAALSQQEVCVVRGVHVVCGVWCVVCVCGVFGACVCVCVCVRVWVHPPAAGFIHIVLLAARLAMNSALCVQTV